MLKRLHALSLLLFPDGNPHYASLERQDLEPESLSVVAVTVMAPRLRAFLMIDARQHLAQLVLGEEKQVDEAPYWMQSWGMACMSSPSMARDYERGIVWSWHKRIDGQKKEEG